MISKAPGPGKPPERKHRGHLISIVAEEALVRIATKARDVQARRRAEALLVTLDLDFIGGLAAKVARHVIHKKLAKREPDEMDLRSVGVQVFLEKLPKWDPKYRARLRNYAFLDMKRAMYREVCDRLEIVRLSRDGKAHKAHKDLEAGMSIDQVVAKHGISREVALSLHRGTVSIDKLEEEGYELEGFGGAPDKRSRLDGESASLLERIWEQLDPFERDVLCMVRLYGEEPKRRARAFAVNRVELQLLEQGTLRRVRDLLDGNDDEGPLVDPTGNALDAVWNRLEEPEKDALAAVRLFPNHLWRRARALGLAPHVVRTIERRAISRARSLLTARV